MRLTIAAAFVLLMPLMLAAAPTTLPMQTSDGVAYGDAQPIKGFNPPNLPTIGRMLGVPAAEWVGHRKIISSQHSLQTVKALEQANHVAFRGERHPQFVTADASGGFAGFDVADGRIVAAYFGGGQRTKDQWAGIADQISKFGEKAKPKFYGQNSTDFFGHIQVTFLQPDWFLFANPDLSQPAADAIAAGKVIIGMTEREADAALWRCGKRVHEDASGTRQVKYFEQGSHGEEDKALVTFTDSKVSAVSTF